MRLNITQKLWEELLNFNLRTDLKELNNKQLKNLILTYYEARLIKYKVTPSKTLLEAKLNVIRYLNILDHYELGFAFPELSNFICQKAERYTI